MHDSAAIVVHHGGIWEVKPRLKYVGGETTTYDNLPSVIDAPFIRALIDLLQHKDVVKMHYLDPMLDLDTGCRFLYDEASFMPFIEWLNLGYEIHVYLEHGSVVVDLDDDYEDVSFTELLAMQLSTNSPMFSDALESNNALVTMDDIDYDDEGTDIDDEELTDARLELKKSCTVDNDVHEELARLEKELQRDGIDVDSEFEGYSDDENPNFIESIEDEEVGYIAPPINTSKRKRPNVYKDNTRPEDTHFSLHQVFDNSVQFKDAIQNYCVANGVETKYFKNNQHQVGANCTINGCKWRIWASTDSKTGCFSVKTYNGVHSHGRQRVVRNISYKWIAKNYAPKFKLNPYVKLDEIVNTVRLDKGIKISIYLAYKAKKAAIDLIVGEYKEQYGLLNQYAAEIKRSNPRNTVKFNLEDNVFKRMYIGFDALIQGFKAGCRPFISVDGCFLKGPYGGTLLVAVGRDGNNQMYPISWAVVESETEDSWCWFLSLLADDLGTMDGAGYVVMSDQQKGLLNGVELMLPASEKRCCARHVYMNFRGIFGGNNEYRRLFWKAAKSTTEVQFRGHMEQLRMISTAAADDLLDRNYTKWCRAYFTPVSTCDNVDNNMSEVFNAYILKSRHKPIISMLEDIREALMERLHKKRDFLVNKNVMVCPRIQKQIEKAKVDARGWFACWNGDKTHDVREGLSQDRYVVDINSRTCTCNAWQLSGIPCNHGVAAIWHEKDNPENYLAEYYKKSYYLKAYQWSIDALRGPKQWESSPLPPIKAPELKEVKANRPTTKRKKSVGEETTKASKQGSVQTCFYCGQSGHNKKKCTLDDESKAKISENKAKAEALRKLKWEKKQKVAQERKIQKQAHQERLQATKSTPRRSGAYTPMHKRGYGQLTYSNGYSRPANIPTNQREQQQRPQSHGRNVAVYSDYEGSQTMKSCTTMHDRPPMPLSQTGSSSNSSFLDPKGRPCISSQTLQEQAHNRSFARSKNKGKTSLFVL